MTEEMQDSRHKARDVGKDAEMNATRAVFDYNKVVVSRTKTQWESSVCTFLHEYRTVMFHA